MGTLWSCVALTEGVCGPGLSLTCSVPCYLAPTPLFCQPLYPNVRCPQARVHPCLSSPSTLTVPGSTTWTTQSTGLC